MTGAPAGLAGTEARPGSARTLMPGAVAALETVWGTLGFLGWLAGMIIRQPRAVRQHARA